MSVVSAGNDNVVDWKLAGDASTNKAADLRVVDESMEFLSKKQTLLLVIRYFHGLFVDLPSKCPPRNLKNLVLEKFSPSKF